MKVTDPAAPESEKKRVLYVITKGTWGGAQRYVFDIAVDAKRRGHEVLVVIGTDGELTERLREAGVPVETISSMKRDIGITAEWKSFRELLSIMKRFNPDIVHGNSSKAGALAALAGRINGVETIVFTAHAWAFNEGRPLWQRFIIGGFHYATVLLSHVTVCVSEAVRTQALWMPFVHRRLHMVHDGIDAVELVPRSDARDRLAPDFVREFPDALWVGAIAELHRTKGLDTLIMAFDQFSQSGPSAVLVIIGDGEEWEHLQKLIQISDAPDRIVLVGFVKDAASYLSAFDLFVLPSRSEALGYAILEAGLASLPVIASRVGGIPEVIKDTESGVLVAPNDVDALASGLRTVADNEPLRQALGKALYERVTRVFSKEKMVRETLSLYVEH